MTATAHTPAASGAATSPMRSRARLAGVLYLLTFVSIPTLALYNPIRDHADFILGAGSQTGVLWGALTEVIVGLAGISTALVLFPVLKRQNESAALGLVAARLLETTLIFVSVTSLLTIVTLRTHRRLRPGRYRLVLTLRAATGSRWQERLPARVRRP